MKSKPSNHLLISAVLLTAALTLSACGGSSKSVMAVAETTAAAAGYSAPIPGMLTIKTNGNEGINDE